MKKIEAILEPSEVEAMQRNLSAIGIPIMTVAEVKGFGGQGAMQVYRGVRFESPYLTEAKVEVVVPDEMMESAVALILETAKKDPSGQSRISVFPLENAAGPSVGRKSAVAV
jgi:nitrogen regulatory protein P-II 1